MLCRTLVLHVREPSLSLHSRVKRSSIHGLMAHRQQWGRDDGAERHVVRWSLPDRKGCYFYSSAVKLAENSVTLHRETIKLHLSPVSEGLLCVRTSQCQAQQRARLLTHKPQGLYGDTTGIPHHLKEPPYTLLKVVSVLWTKGALFVPPSHIRRRASAARTQDPARSRAASQTSRVLKSSRMKPTRA